MNLQSDEYFRVFINQTFNESAKTINSIKGQSLMVYAIPKFWYLSVLKETFLRSHKSHGDKGFFYRYGVSSQLIY